MSDSGEQRILVVLYFCLLWLFPRRSVEKDTALGIRTSSRLVVRAAQLVAGKYVSESETAVVTIVSKHPPLFYILGVVLRLATLLAREHIGTCFKSTRMESMGRDKDLDRHSSPMPPFSTHE
jgi:hypothetical protein